MDGSFRLVVLGSGCGLPTAERDTAGYLVHAGDDVTLLDCPGSVVHKLARNGIDLGRLHRLVLTHDHVDHVYGLPHLLHAMAIRGDLQGLEILAPAQTLARIAAIISAHGLDRPEYPAVRPRPVPMVEETCLHKGDGLTITASPAVHGRDTVAVRFEAYGRSLVVSSDTRPCDSLVRLARRADLLVHDCGGLHADSVAGFGEHHASAREAGESAAAARAGALLLTHLPTDDVVALAALCREAAAAFGATVAVAEDGRIYVPGEPTAGTTSLR